MKKILFNYFNFLFLTAFLVNFTFEASAEELSKGLNSIQQDFISGKLTLEQALLQKFYYGFDKSKLDTRYNFENDNPGKCGTEFIQQFYQNKEYLSKGSVDLIESYIERPFLQTKILATYFSPSGKFELTYSTSGAHAVPSADGNTNGVPDFVEWIADYFDYSWKYSIDTLGFLAPPIGAGKYQIGFENMDYYGYCMPIGGKATRIVMHNTFLTFPSNTDPEGNQKGAAKATAIHEFKHALQIVYNNWNEPGWFIEMDATWMEDIGYDQVNDYYNYLGSSHLLTPGRAFNNGSGYEDCLWLHYISQKHGVESNKNIWNRRITNPSENIYSTFDEILKTYSSTFVKGLKEYFTWNFLSGTRATTLLPTYKEAAFYPTSFLCRDRKSLPDSSSGCELSFVSANYLSYSHFSLNKFIRVSYFGTPAGNQSIQLLIKYKNNTMELRTFDLSAGNSFDYIITKKLNEIEYLGIIPIVTSITAGNFPYKIKVSPFQTAEFTHTPIRDTETPSQKIITAKVIRELSLAISDSLKLFYKTGSGNYISQKMNPTGNPDEYSATIPSFPLDTDVSYYMSIYDSLGNYSFYPESAPAVPFEYYIGPDTKAPVVIHSHNLQITRYDTPQWIFANVSDNIGLDSIIIEHRINSGTLLKSEMKFFQDDIYYYKMNLDPISLQEGDKVDYRITAVDNSSNQNRISFPSSGFNSININKGKMYTNQPNKQIRDNYLFGIRDTLTISEDIFIKDLNIVFKANHNRISDLEFRIIPPGKLTFQLFFRPGLNTKFSNAKNPNIILDQEAFLSFSNFQLIDSSLAVGTFKPDTTDLTSLNGMNAKGNWIVIVYDRASGEIGTLTEWGLIIRGDSVTTNVEEQTVYPSGFVLYQNYPNPFNPSTVISYRLSAVSHVSLKVFDLLGREVETLVDEIKEPGVHNSTFRIYGEHRRTIPNSALSSGVYYYQLRAGSFVETKKMILMR
ncbi:MAG: T9SS type A sorting domain-containing protein [Ignavibacteria bacterium]|nr:T9SS type A sorting domain-containing protein [Ignavibacteria bacterium]